MPEIIDQIVDQSHAVAQAEAELRRLVRVAHSERMPISEIAAATGKTRQTIYRWLETGARGRLNVSQTLDQALHVLAGNIGPTNAANVRRRAGHKPDVQALGMKIGLSSLDSQGLAGMDDEEKGILKLGQEVLAAAQSKKAQTGAWPTHVTLD